jgi:glyoxylase-like metal-dependent hydrolase (beta-lactamase superfamily II)
VIDGSTVVIDPPDGNMKDYIAALETVRDLRPAALAPGHGEVINDPGRAIQWIIDHRLAREAKVMVALRSNPGLSTMGLVPHVYTDVDKKLYRWAERSLLAHLLKLESDGAAVRKNEIWVAA